MLEGQRAQSNSLSIGDRRTHMIVQCLEGLLRMAGDQKPDQGELNKQTLKNPDLQGAPLSTVLIIYRGAIAEH